jgi:hypothetical protein
VELQKYMLDNMTIQNNIVHLKKINMNMNNNNMIVKHNYDGFHNYEKQTHSSEKSNNEKSNKINNNNIENTEDIIFPQERDSLFWCFYIMKHGYFSYEMLDNRNEIVDRKIKIHYVEKIRQNKELIKTYKFTTITHLENVLANEKCLDVKTFFSLCVYENLNVMYVKNKTYYELLMNDSPTIFVIKLLKNNKYSLETTLQNKIEYIKQNFYKIDNISNPLKAFSAYKLDELISISNKLSLNTINDTTQKPMKKKELYDNIYKYF